MRILGTNSIELTQAKSPSVTTLNPQQEVQKQGSELPIKVDEVVQRFENNEDIKQKVQDAVSKMNEILQVTNNTSKFLYHEGLDRYYVTVVNSETEEVVKEIPPKKLLDAFYEMQKMLGMIVDEKI